MTNDLSEQHTKMIQALLNCAPDTERARELRAMILRLEQIDPTLEQQRVALMQKRLIDTAVHIALLPVPQTN